MPSHLTLNVGNVQIIALTDMSFPFPMPLDELWPEVPADAWDEYRQRYPDTFHNDLMLIEIGCYLLRTPEQTILIDTGYGPGPIESIGGLEGELMDHLAAQNVQPHEIDTVFLSHLHSDHVGWNTIEQDGNTSPPSPTPVTSSIRKTWTTSAGPTSRPSSPSPSWVPPWNDSSTSASSTPSPKIPTSPRKSAPSTPPATPRAT